MADENPYRSPEFSSPPAEKQPDKDEKPGNSGCLVLLLIGIPLLDACAMMVSHAGPYGPIVQLAGLGGFVCGAILGSYVSVRFHQDSWWSSWRWAIYGVLGLCLAGAVSFWATLPRGR